MLHCPFCTAELADASLNDGRCPSCGSVIHWEAAPEEAAAPAAASPAPAVIHDSNPSIGDVLRTIVSRGASAAADQPAPPFSTSATVNTEVSADTGKLQGIWGKSLTVQTKPSMTIKGISDLNENVASSLVIRARQVQYPGEAPLADAEYELLHTIGEGGVGVVYAARQGSIDRTVALKMLRHDYARNTDQRHKFLSEAVVTGELDHPNIVPIYDLGSDPAGTLFYSMKRVRGTPWSSVIGSKPLADNLDILMSVADAVAFAHARGVIHRDLKPENVMLGDFGEVLVMDWGIALATPQFNKSGHISQTTSMGGTPAYMAPEMATGPLELIGSASDVYLLGAILFEIIAGKPPHTGADVMGCLYAAARNVIQPTDQTGELLDIAYQAMSSRIDERYASVQDFQAAIRECRSHSESVALTARAAEELAQALKTRDYQDFARALFGYQEAHALWAENVRAKWGEVDARIAYATSALDKADYDLGLSLLSPHEPKQAALRSKLLAAQQERDARQQRLRSMRRIAAMLVAMVLVVVSSACFMIWQANSNLQVAKKKVEASEQSLQKTNKSLISKTKLLEDSEKTLKENQKTLIRNQESLRRNQTRLQEEKERADNEARQARQAQQREALASYLAQIGVSSERIANNSFLDASRLLAQYEQPGNTLFRHWEWGHLRKLCHLDAATLPAGGRVESVARSQSGDLLVCGTAAGAVQVWKFDWPKFSYERAANLEHGGPVYAVAISADGKLLAAAGDLIANGEQRGAIRLWQLAASGKPQGEPRLLMGHRDMVDSLDFAPGGKQLASSSRDETARLWDVASGTLQKTFRGHFGAVWCVRFAPGAQAQQILTTGEDRTVRIWSTQTEERRPKIFRGHREAVFAAAWSPDGRRIASAGRAKQVLLWNPALVQEFDYQAVARVLSTRHADEPITVPDQSEVAIEQSLEGHTAEIRSIEFSRAGTHLLTGGHDNTVRLWNLAAAPAAIDRMRTFRGHGGWVQSCVLAPHEQYAISGGHDEQIKFWSLQDYEEVRTLRGHEDAILGASFSADEQRVITAGRDRRAIIWNAATGQPLKTLDEADEPTVARAAGGERLVADLSEGHEFLVTSAVFFPPGDSRLLTSAGDNTVRIWDSTSGGQIRRLDRTGTVGAIALSDDGKWILTGSQRHDALLWSVDEPHAPPTVLVGHTTEITAVAFSHQRNPAELRLFTGDANGIGRVWRLDAASRSWQIEHKLSGHQIGYGITAARFLPDSAHLLTASHDHAVLHWDLATGLPIVERTLRHPDGVKSLDLSSDGRLAVTLCSTGKDTYRLFAWDVQQATERHIDPQIGGQAITMVALHHDQRSALVTSTSGSASSLWRWDFSQPRVEPLWPQRELTGAIWAAIASADGQHVLAVGGSQARLLSAATGDQERSFNAHGAVTSASFSASRKLAATSGADGDVKVWVADEFSPRFGTVQLKLTQAHAADGVAEAVNSVMFHPAPQLSESWLLTAGDDGTAKLWDISQVEPVLKQTFRGHSGRVHSAVFSPDGRYVLTASVDATARLWDAETGRPIGANGGVLQHRLDVLFANFSPDGKSIITGSDDNVARIWDATHVEQLGEPRELRGHTAAITSVAMSPDGLRAITASQDGMAKLWDLQETPEEVLSLKRHQAEVTSVRFSATGRAVLTSSHDRTAIIWRAEPIAPTIKLANEPLAYSQPGVATAVDPQAILRDPDAAALAGGTLVVELLATAGELGDERLGIAAGSGITVTPAGEVAYDANDGRGPRQIAVPADGAAEAQSIRLRFTEAASVPAVEQLLRNVTFTASQVLEATRHVRFVITDDNGGASHAAVRQIADLPLTISGVE